MRSIVALSVAALLLAACGSPSAGSDGDPDRGSAARVSSCSEPVRSAADAICATISTGQTRYALKGQVDIEVTVRNDGDQVARSVRGELRSEALDFEGGARIDARYSQRRLDFGDIAPNDVVSRNIFARSDVAGDIIMSLTLMRDGQPANTGGPRGSVSFHRLASILPGEADADVDRFFEVRERCLSRHGNNRDEVRDCMAAAGLFD